MAWKADKTTIFAALVAIAAGWERIAFAHDLVLGSLLIGVGIILRIRTFLYFRKLNS